MRLGEEAQQPDVFVRWRQIAGWFEELPGVTDEVARFLAGAYFDFLEARGMSLKQVGKHLPDGVQNLKNFLTMLQEAAQSCRVSVTRQASWDSAGAYLDGRKYWAGVDTGEPGRLWFGTRCRIDPEKAAALGEGELTEEPWVPGRSRWWAWVDLDSEAVHFFARSKLSQLEWLEDFLRDCLDKARSIETPDQPPPPDEPEE